MQADFILALKGLFRAPEGKIGGIFDTPIEFGKQKVIRIIYKRVERFGKTLMKTYRAGI